jgi:hypothetical protein
LSSWWVLLSLPSLLMQSIGRYTALLATIQMDLGTMFLKLHLLHKAWQYHKIWVIHVEWEQVCNRRWWNLYCNLYQFCHCQWNLVVECKGALGFEWTTLAILRLH